MRVLVAIGAALFAAATVAACTSGGSGRGPTPVVPAPMIETFTGTVQVSNSDSHPFTVAFLGQVDITLTAVGPPSTIIMGLFIGQPASTGSSVCLPLTNGSVSTPAGTVPQLSGTTAAGAYCVEILDVGNQTAPVTYTVIVSHP